MACRLVLALLAVSGCMQVIRAQGCDESYTDYTGTLTSPNYPSAYPTDTTCTYIIDVQTARSIRIEFQDVQIEPGYDFLYYGVGTTPDLNNYQGVITGITSPLPVDVPSGTMWFQFISDEVEALTGFSLTWEASDDALPTPTPASTIAPTKPYATPNPVLGLELWCEGTSMTVVFNKDALFPSVPEPEEVHLANDSCVGYAYGANQIAVTTDYDKCDTKVEETDDHVVFRNRLLYGDPISPQLNGDIECRLARHLQAEVVSSPESDNVQFTQVSYGNFTFGVDFYPDVGYGAPYEPDDYPVTVNIGDDLFVEARVVTANDLDLLIDACWATNTPDQDGDSYYLISSGCAKDETVVFYDAPGASQRFSFAAFAFPTGEPQIYLHCQLLTCDANNESSRCQQGCPSRTKRDSDEDDLELHIVSSGAIGILG